MPFITFEGSEACGKSTQVERLARRLKEQGISPAVFREPGGTAIGESIRRLLQDPHNNITAETELLLFEASRAQLVREKLLPALTQGEWVICDRFYDSTTVYQGAARRLKPEIVQRLNDFAAAGSIPDLTFVLDIDREIASARLQCRSVRDRMEEQPEQFYQSVTRAYQELATREPARI